MPRRPSTADDLHRCLFHYRAIVTAVHDGDTCTVDIDLGLSLWVRGAKVRLARIGAPELTGRSAAKGLEARDGSPASSSASPSSSRPSRTATRSTAAGSARSGWSRTASRP